MEILLAAAIALLVALIVLQVILLRKAPGGAPEMGLILARHEAIERAQERAERGIREEVARNREEAAKEASSQRQELQAALSAFAEKVTGELAAMSGAQRGQSETALQGAHAFGERLTSEVGAMAAAQRGQLETLLQQIATQAQSADERLNGIRAEIVATLKGFNDSMVRSVTELGNSQGIHLARLREENAAALEQIRRTVDEQLQTTLEKRLGESFKLVSDRLEQVHRGLGEMQSLASGVGDLKKLLSNVRARGTWGEVQLRMLLEQVLTPDQYGVNVATTGTAERVEFAIKLPGDDEKPVWLPIDAKFPKEDYERLLDAAERADTAAVEESARQLEARIRGCAKDIHEKYVMPPLTTDFGIMYLPCEGLYAEALRRPGLIEALQREHRVTVAGPMTLAAILNSLQMGFRTLAIQKRSSEVWEVLGGVKSEFAKYAEVLAKVQKKLQEATNTVDLGLTRTRAIQRKLKDVEGAGTTAGDEDEALSLDGPGLLTPARTR
jgi:DNA recombination protein RmuC